jgi:hypothetical protein
LLTKREIVTIMGYDNGANFFGISSGTGIKN